MMDDRIIKQSAVFKNEGSPFTELFSLLKRYELTSEGLPTLAYELHEIKIMHQHVENVIGVLLQGLQDIGYLINFISVNKTAYRSSLSHIGCFITLISNLAEALNDLRLDADHVLKISGAVAD